MGLGPKYMNTSIKLITKRGPLWNEEGNNLLFEIRNINDNIVMFDEYAQENLNFFNTWNKKMVDGGYLFIYLLSDQQNSIINQLSNHDFVSNLDADVFHNFLGMYMNIKYKTAIPEKIIPLSDGAMANLPRSSRCSTSSRFNSNKFPPTEIPNKLFIMYVSLLANKDRLYRNKYRLYTLLNPGEDWRTIPSMKLQPKSNLVTDAASLMNDLLFFLDKLKPNRFIKGAIAQEPASSVNCEWLDISTILCHHNVSITLLDVFYKKHDILPISTRDSVINFNNKTRIPLTIDTLVYWASVDDISIRNNINYECQIADGKNLLIKKILNEICYKGINEVLAAYLFYYHKNNSDKYVFDTFSSFAKNHTLYCRNDVGLYKKDMSFNLLAEDFAIVLTYLIADEYERETDKIKFMRNRPHLYPAILEHSSFIKDLLNHLQEVNTKNKRWLNKPIKIIKPIVRKTKPNKVKSKHGRKNIRNFVIKPPTPKEVFRTKIDCNKIVNSPIGNKQIQDQLQRKPCLNKHINVKDVVGPINIRNKNRIIRQLKTLYTNPSISAEFNKNRSLIAFEDGIYNTLINKLKTEISNEFINETTGYNYKSVLDDECDYKKTRKEIMGMFRLIFPLEHELEYFLGSLALCLEGDKLKKPGVRNRRFFVWTSTNTNQNELMSDYRHRIANFVSNCLGGYCKRIDSNYFIRTPKNKLSRKGDSEMCDKRYCRCVFGGEINPKLADGVTPSKWSMDKLITNTSNGSVTCRERMSPLHSFTFKCGWPLFILSNYLPKVTEAREIEQLPRICTIINFPPLMANLNLYNLDWDDKMKTREWKITLFHILLKYHQRKKIDLNNVPERFKRNMDELVINKQVECFIKDRLVIQKGPINKPWGVCFGLLYEEFKTYTDKKLKEINDVRHTQATTNKSSKKVNIQEEIGRVVDDNLLNVNIISCQKDFLEYLISKRFKKYRPNNTCRLYILGFKLTQLGGN